MQRSSSHFYMVKPVLSNFYLLNLANHNETNPQCRRLLIMKNNRIHKMSMKTKMIRLSHLDCKVSLSMRQALHHKLADTTVVINYIGRKTVKFKLQ